MRSALPDAAAGEDPDLTHQVAVLDVGRPRGWSSTPSSWWNPDRIVGESPRGRNDLYVALTRATQRLVIVEP